MEFIGIGLAIGLPALGVAVGQGLAVASALDGIWRQPEATRDIRSLLFIGLAFMEALAIYGLLIAFLLLGRLG